MLVEHDITFVVTRADRSFRSWLEKYDLVDLIDESRFYPTNRHAAAAFREEVAKVEAKSDEGRSDKRES